MKILLLADLESRYLWDFFEKSKLEGLDLVLAAGDLAPQYLSFIATYTTAPVLYVHGNHDTCYDKTPPDGCICVDDTVYTYKGLRIMGLGGSMCYNMSPYQYTEKEMRALATNPKILLCDEATSALDSISESKIQEAKVQTLESRRSGYTSYSQPGPRNK